MSRTQVVDFNKLPDSIKVELEDFIEENSVLPNHQLVTVLDAYLSWNGIRGFTGSILTIMEACQ